MVYGAEPSPKSQTKVLALIELLVSVDNDRGAHPLYSVTSNTNDAETNFSNTTSMVSVTVHPFGPVAVIVTGKVPKVRSEERRVGKGCRPRNRGDTLR